MAQVKDITTSGAGNSKPSAPASNAGSVAKSSSSSSSGKSAKASVSRGTSRGSGSISKAASNARAAISAGARYAAAKSGSSVGTAAKAASNSGFGMHKAAATLNTAETNRESRQGSGFHQDVLNAQGQRQVDARQQTTNDELSYLAAATNALADKMYKGEEFNRDSYTDEAFAMASQINQGWKDGVGQTAVVKDGKVVVEADKDMPGNEHYWYSLDEDGKKVATQNAAHREENLEMLNNDIQRWTNFANSGQFTKADVIKESAGVKQWINAIDNGLVDNYQMEDGTSARDYLQSLFDGRNDLFNLADRREAGIAYDNYIQKYNDIQLGLAQGAHFGADLEPDVSAIQAYADRYKDDEILGPAFAELSEAYYATYNRERVRSLQTQTEALGSQLKAAQSSLIVAEQSENSLNFADVVASDADRELIKNRAEEARTATKGIYDQQMAVQAQIDQLNADYRARFMTPEVEEALSRLNLKKGERDKVYTQMMREINANVTDPSQIVTQDSLRARDQKTADDWNNGLGFAEQYYNLQDRLIGIGKSFALRTAESGLNLAAMGAHALDYARGLDNVDQEALQAQGYATDAPMLTPNITDPTKAYSEQFNENGGNGGRLANAADTIENVADKIGSDAQAELAKVKQGLSKGGQFMVDLGSTALDMGLDAITGGGLTTMFARVAGQGIGEARRAGATAGEQFLYGLSNASIEVMTEKLTDGVGFLYGKGVSTDVVEKAISRLASSDAGANFLRLLAGAVGEGGEEVISDLLNPFTQWIIDENARDNRTVDIDLSEMLYDFLLGGAMGLLGQGVEAVNGSYATKNKAQTDAMTERYDALMEELGKNPRQVTGAEQAEIKRLEARMGDRENGSNPIGLFGSPFMQQIRRNTQNITTRSKGVNRHDTATGVLAEGFENAGYVNSTNADEDFKTATTGAEGPRTDAEADQQSYDQMIEEEAQKAVTSEETKADAKEVVGKLQNAVAQGRLNMKESVRDVKASEFQKVEGQSLVERVGTLFKSLGNKVKSAALGGQEVILDERGVKSDIANGLGKAKAATFAAVPDVIANGKIIDTQKNWKGRGYDTQVIAGRISIDGEGAYVACVVTSVEENGKNRFYLHEVVDANGSLIYSFDGMNKNAPAANIKTGVAKNGITGVATGDTASIAQTAKNGNTTSTAVRDDGTITDEQRRQLDQFPKDISNEEAKQYAEAASTEWPVYIELRSGSAFQYDGKQLWVSDEDGLASNPREMSHDEFARNLEKWADSESYSYITFENTPIKVKGDIENANVKGTPNDRGNGAAGQVGRTEPTIRSLLARSGEVSRTLAEKQAGRIKDEALRDSYLNKVSDEYIKQGAKFIPEEEYTPFMQQITEIAREAGVEHVAFWWTSETSRITGGTYTPEVNALDLVFVNNDSSQAKMTLKHELTHIAIDKQHISDLEDFRQIFEDAFSSVDNAEKARRQLDYSYNLVKRWYAYGIANELSVKYPTAEQWRSLSKEEQDAAISALPANAIEKLDRKIHEEFICEAIAGRTSWFFLAPDLMVPWQNNIRDYFADKGYFSNELHGKIDALEIEFKQGDESVSQNNYEELGSTQISAEAEEAQQEKPRTGRTPGRVKQSQSAFEQDVATKGERANTDTAVGEAEFLSRTNEARSRTADALTDTQEKADAQVQRLLQEDYVWNDDDVVIAQKLMFDMVKAIRNYQMHKASRMKPEAFKRLTDQYNQLMTKHQQKLSAAGQELQANYMFSTGDKIVMKAAQTFLGFTKDGRFAGTSVNAKNAKIYAGIEEASKRIQKAVDAEDVQGLAKICKDISNIRNVKKMFGPLGGFADAMETRVLERIAKGENAAENLENLAYGNLNAICDDVQPYKALNAAKTIRVMNMLFNTATIVNNLANNFAQGAVSKSVVSQAFTQMAAKPFEALTGQQAISKAQRGKEANRAVRNAQVEALETATLMQMYGITEENGRLELNDRGMFNPNINAFEQTMSLYKFLTGMGVEATDKMQAAGILKSMELGIDADIKAGKIDAHTREQRMQEARHEVNRLLYKDDNEITNWVQHGRDVLNKKIHFGNERLGTIGLGDITMAFAKIPANVVRARLAMTPEGALLQVAQYARGVNKAKRMHAEVLAKGIVEKWQDDINDWNETLQTAKQMEWSRERDQTIRKAESELEKINRMMWAEAQDACRGSVYRNLRTMAQNYNENMMFNEAVERAGYMNAKEMSQFEAAQLSRKIGRAATSAGMMVLGSVLRAAGALRDFDQEPDDELRKMNSDKGYRGLMMNLSAIGRKNHEWKDGDLIIDGEFLEVIAMPLTIGATAAEAAATAQDAKTWSWLKSMAGNGIAKTFEAVGDIPGMADAINMYESLTSAYNTDYDEKVNRLGAGLLQYAANTVPSFFMPNAISQATAGIDNKVRDVYTADNAWEQAANIFKNKFPGLRNTIPVSVDVWGNERTYGEGLWGAVNKMLLPGDVQVYRKNKYEAEIERMVKAGYGNATPKTVVNSSFEVGDEKYTMTAQEKLDFKAARNSQQRELFEAFIDSDYYKGLSDAERMKVFQSLKTSAERDAKQDMLNGRQLDVEITRDKWETELTDVNDQLQFLAAKQMANNVLDRDAEDMDYAAVDEYLAGAYKALDETQRNLLDSSYSRLDDMFEAKSSYGIGSEMFTTGYDIYKDYMSDEGRARVQGGYKDWEGSQMYTDIAKATGASEKQMDFFEKKFVLYNNNAVVPEKYNSFVDAGWSRESAQSLMVGMSGLQPTNGRKTVSYKQRLTEIALIPGLTEAQRWEAFFEYCPSSYTSVIRSMSNKKSNGSSYEKALRAAGKWDA